MLVIARFFVTADDVRIEMGFRRLYPVALGLLTALILAGAATPVTASPAPVSGCPPCGDGFVRAAASHDLDTEVRRGEATVRVHENGSATWTVRVVPTNESVLNRLAENETLARSVAADSFGIRYGSGIAHKLIAADVANGAFVIQYQTLDVVRRGMLGTHTLTYFRDSPGAYVYTDLGADELTVVSPPGMTVARGFGEVNGRRMTATELPDARDGPFVVFAPEDSLTPGLLGVLAVLNALGGVIARNFLLFVVVPGGILVGGLAGIRRFVDPSKDRNTTLLGTIIAVGGAGLLVGTLIAEADALPAVTGNLLIGGFGGIVLFALGAGVAVPGIRRYLTAGRLIGSGIVVAGVAVAVSDGVLGASAFHKMLELGAALLPAAVALGWADARSNRQGATPTTWLFLGLSVAVIGVLVVSAPLTALGGSLFLLVPVVLTVAAIGGVIAAGPLYLLGAAGATAELS